MYPMIECSQVPEAHISRVQINPWDDNECAICTWNGTVELYNTNSGKRISVHELPQKPPLFDMVWVSKSSLVYGGADGIIYQDGVEIYRHDAVISSLTFVPDYQYVASGSFDGMFIIYNLKHRKIVFQNDFTPMKVFCLTTCEPNLIILTVGERNIWCYDLKSKQLTERIPARYTSRSLAGGADCFAVGTMGGRIFVDTFPNDGSPLIAFRAHTAKDPNICYPVNAVAIDPANTSIMASGASNGTVYLWSPKDKVRLAILGHFHTSISSLSYSADGHKLAVAVSYCFERGESPHAPEQLVIFTLQ